MNKKQNSLSNLKPNKSSWNNSETVAVRVPKILKDKILLYARQLDSGELPESDDNKTQGSTNDLAIALSNLMVKVENKEKGYKSNSSGQLIKELGNLLDSHWLEVKVKSKMSRDFQRKNSFDFFPLLEMGR